MYIDGQKVGWQTTYQKTDSFGSSQQNMWDGGTYISSDVQTTNNSETWVKTKLLSYCSFCCYAARFKYHQGVQGAETNVGCVYLKIIGEAVSAYACMSFMAKKTVYASTSADLGGSGMPLQTWDQRILQNVWTNIGCVQIEIIWMTVREYACTISMA